MELCKFKGTVYGKIAKQFFIFESEWDSFRPVERIAWDGTKIIIVDQVYKKDIFHSSYGFGSPEMKAACKKLTEITELGIPESESLPWLDTEWFRDRKCTFAYDCTPRTPDSWARYIRYQNSKPRTLRKYHHSRKTKRLVPS